MTDVAKLQLIEAHHIGTLTKEEQRQIDQLIQEDPAFAQELEDYQLLLDGFDMLALEAFEDGIQSFEAKYQQEDKIVPIGSAGGGSEMTTTKNKRFNLGRFASIAAAVAVLIFVPITYYSTMMSTPDAFDSLYETPTAFVVRGEAKEAKEQAYNLAMSIYNKGDYAKSIELLNTYVDTYGEQEYEAIFYLASAQMASEQYKASSMNFEHVAENAEDSAFYRQQAEWYLVLAQYKLENTSVALKLAERIQENPKHNFYNKAVLFLEQLKK
jgi:TolA-binding protein